MKVFEADKRTSLITAVKSFEKYARKIGECIDDEVRFQSFDPVA
jgi:hypothetical protein